MSRRKQAKPRACHKLGDNAEDADIAVGSENTAGVSELLEPKEELLSDMESIVDEQDTNSDEHESVEQSSMDRRTAAVSDGMQLLKTEEAEEENATNLVNDKNNASNKSSQMGNNNNTDNNSKSATVGVALDSADVVVAGGSGDSGIGVAATAQDPNKQQQQEFHDSDVDDVVGDDDDDDDVDDLLESVEAEDEDLHSLDSFYSDMYSTHTSSSYSPSISDGTLTPNSLPPHSLHLPGLPSHVHERTQDGQTSPSLGPKANGNVNASEGAQLEVGTVAEAEAKKRQAQRHMQPHRHVEHALKMAHKLRKIDRDAGTAGGASASSTAAQKFDKLTGESIKSCRPDGSYQCQFCDKSFPRLGYLKKHEQSHAEHLPFKCDYCARLFKHKRSRDRHTKLHTGDRRYRCPHCEAAFSRSDHLKIHMKTHDNQKPFQCTICNRGYNTAAALTSHMQNHKKQAAILAAGGNPQALNYSPRSTGSASSNGSLNKRRYALAIASDSSPSRLEYPKRVRSNAAAALQLRCSYCPKSVEFSTLEQLNAHVQSAHEKEYQQTQQQLIMASPAPTEVAASGFQLSCEYCTMKFASIATLFQHMRSTHIDRLTSPNSYFEHFNRLATTGTFSPRLALAAGIQHQQQQHQQQHVDHSSIKLEQPSLPSPKVMEPTSKASQPSQEEEPTDLSQHNKRRSASPQTSPGAMPEKPGVFFCNQCNAGLPDFESFRNHLKTHIVEGLNLVCQHCGMSLQDQTEFERHVIGHFLITNSEYNCSASCSKSYTKPDELQKHLMDQHVVTMFKCALCAELFDTKVAIQVHFACAHTAETKLLRCSACMEVFRSETDFQIHVKTRHHLANSLNNNNNTGAGALGLNTLQCMFCRVVCSSELEMHFHLAAHARQFRCPSCPETFHVEFLLDRHMQTHHSGASEHGSAEKDSYEEQQSTLSPMNSLYVNALFGGKPPMLPPIGAQTNNNNSIIDYNVAFAAAHLQKGLFPPPNAAAANKFYSPLQVDTASAMKQHPALMYGLSQRYFDTNRALMDMYAAQQEKNYFVSPKAQQQQQQQQAVAITPQPDNRGNARDELNNTVALPGFSCGMCERNDFRTESEVHSHRKIVHNMKTGVSLRCAYCCGNFKSRSELEHHMKTCHNSTGKHKCLICDEVFPSPAILAEHKLQHSKVGQSGKCSHCGKPLADVAAFKEHLAEHGNNNNESQVPVQCICCRQTLHSDFEISLHAKFHTKSGSSNLQEAVCALCLEPLGNGNTVDGPAKVCEKCCRKHNLNARPRKRSTELYERPSVEVSYIENRCNLCKMILPHAHKLQEHLVEHTFAGTEERGYNCYICSAVFTAPAGLLNHMNEHGPNARPYDCNLCTEKYYFRAELDHHLREHELRPPPPRPKEERPTTPQPTAPPRTTTMASTPPTTVKQELYESEAAEAAKEQEATSGNGADDDEYIEVEQVPELRTEETASAAHGSNSPLA